jgi:hypothetical protein
MKTFAKTITLTAAQVNDLDNTPINVIPAPRQGYALIPQKFIAAKTSGTAAGTCSGAPIGLVYSGDNTLLVALGTAANCQTLLSTGAVAANYLCINGTNVASPEVYTNVGIDVSAPGATIASFTGTLQVTILFNIVKIG